MALKSPKKKDKRVIKKNEAKNKMSEFKSLSLMSSDTLAPLTKLVPKSPVTKWASHLKYCTKKPSFSPKFLKICSFMAKFIASLLENIASVTFPGKKYISKNRKNEIKNSNPRLEIAVFKMALNNALIHYFTCHSLIFHKNPAPWWPKICVLMPEILLLKTSG